MSEVVDGDAILTREELDALLAAVAEGQEAEERASAGSRPFRESAGHAGRQRALQRMFEDFAAEQGRALSTLHEIPIRFAFLGCETATVADFRSSLLEVDRVAVLDLEPGGLGYLLLARPMLFSWMTIAFGAKAGARRAPIPSRPYTRIEERFLRLVSSQLVAQLVKTWRQHIPMSAKLRSIEEPIQLQERDPEPVVLAHFDVTGFGDLCRIRLAFPPDAFVFGGARPSTSTVSGPSALEEPVRELSVRVGVEAGSAELALSGIAALRVGDVIPLQRSDPEGLVVRVEGKPKFRAVRGAVGRRLAAQVTARL